MPAAHTSTATEHLPQWYAISTTPRHEKHVAEMLEERCVENYLPVYVTTRTWKKRAPVTLTLPLFPTYLFVRIPTNRRAAVLSTPGVTAIVGNSRQAIAISEAEINALRAGFLHSNYEPHPYLAVGERVRINEGAFAGMEGILVRENDAFKVVISVGPILQGVAIAVDRTAIEPAQVSA